MDTSIIRGGVRLPCSSARNCRDKFIKLLRRVDPDAGHGFGFEGVFLRPGAMVTDAELHPDAAYPATPVLLEHMRAPAAGIPGHRRSASIYILWRYENHAWSELGRAQSASWEWAADLRPLALRALREARAAALAVVQPDMAAIARRISTALDSELRELEPPDRFKLIGAIHDQFAARLSAFAP